MTFFGNRKSGRHLLRNISRRSKEKSGKKRKSGKKDRKPWSLKKKLLVIPGIAVGTCLILTTAAFGYLKWGVKPPVVNPNPVYTGSGYVSNDPDRPPQVNQPPSVVNEPGAPDEVEYRIPGRYTFLIMATDDGSNTDTIMVASFDAVNMKIDVVNIPRDTMVNVAWHLKKVNSIYANMRLRYRGESDDRERAMEDTADELSKILGFRVDFWALVNLRAFVTLVNSIGGVDFYVPTYMNYDDYDQNLHIHYNQGMQHLNGQQALEVVRFRNTYASGDIRRIGVQQDFLTAAVQQILEKRENLSVSDLAAVFLRDVKTNIPLDDLIWFGMRFLQLDADSITFSTMPGFYEDNIGPESYVTIYVDEWLEMVNSILSPLTEDITDTGVSILTRGADRRLYVTDGNRLGDPSWGASSRGTGYNPGTGTSGGVSSAPPSPSPTSNSEDDDGDETDEEDELTDDESDTQQEGLDDESDDEFDETDDFVETPESLPPEEEDEGEDPQDEFTEQPSGRSEPVEEDPDEMPEDD